MWFNRDEKKARPVADPPSVREVDGVNFLSPRDPQGGGTWMVANEHGVVVCLLNKWELDDRPVKGPRKSRGLLVWKMGVVRTVDEVREMLVELEGYPAFTMVGISAEGERAWEWDGDVLREVGMGQPLTSSSYCFEAVKESREAAFAEGEGGDEYHGSVGLESTAYTVRMNRPDAQTWSRSRVVVDEEITWSYLGEKLDLAGEPERTVAKLRRR